MGQRKRRPADTQQAREDQLISLAYDLVEKRLEDGTATAQETVTFIKMGSGREQLERKRIENENLLLSARVDELASAKRVEVLMSEALQAFTKYSPNGGDEEEEFGYDAY